MLKQKNKSQHLATISLAVMAIGFLATLPIRDSLWGIILQGGFEAGLVGGLADWFAVTALFRHPLGIPIPHTALLPKNRKRIIAGIISMLENDWLTKESIRKKIDTINFSKKLFEIVDKELYSKAVQKNFILLIQHLIKTVDTKRIAPIIEEELKSQLNKLNTNNYLPVMVDQVMDRKYDEKTLDYILKEINEWAEKDSTKFKLGGLAVDAVENIKADGFMQFALKSFSNLVNEEKLGNIIQSLILKGVASYRDPFNQNRQTLMIHIHKKLQAIKNDEKIYEELSQLKTHLITKWEPEEQILSFLEQLQQKAYDLVENPSFLEDFILPMINDGLENLKADSEKVKSLETWIKHHISSFIDKNHSRIGKLVEENLEKLDDKTLIHMVETNVGKDLQWIRVNGAVCGFLIGLILVGIKAII
ncbi:hypothetical protein BABA_24040 [Neobacillus bataviensis LMG 21833]|uniref:DUF445 domain-containing protein n=1 Tax=Neobacillus bataviensis LMG 21833 TaxID=1117379 RepID=K6D6M9_9BACI|nr:DUF445 domain-containing protein [Neobacillus bataviensis]EKN63944.1 hypothetical protein BABA_24040 [Neobacillus bataviensis LMG 21833]